MFEDRKLNISFPGNGRSNTTPRISLPITWLRDMNIDFENPAVIVSFDGNSITIVKNDDLIDINFLKELLAAKERTYVPESNLVSIYRILYGSYDNADKERNLLLKKINSLYKKDEFDLDKLYECILATSKYNDFIMMEQSKLKMTYNPK